MSFKINIKGLEITVSSASEAADLIRELTGSANTKNIQQPKIYEHSPVLEAYASSVKALAQKFLLTIAKAPPQGPSTEEIMDSVGVTDGRGIGGRLISINNTIKLAGFNADDVYTNPKTNEGRVWLAGPKIHEAIEKFKEHS